MSQLGWSSIGDAHALRAAGLFVAEGRRVVDRLLESGRPPGFDVVRVLATPAAVRALSLDERVPGVLDIRSVEEMQDVTGFNFHRGVLALVRRPTGETVDALLARLPAGAPLVVADHVVDVDNVGSLFRNARALGAAGVLLDDTSADPLYRKAVRTSMGAVLDLPWAVASRNDLWAAVRAAGYRMIALTPACGAEPLRSALDGGNPGGRLAIVVGNEGEGLGEATLHACDASARIPMANGADSLNVATALAIALYEAGRQRK